MVEETLTPSPRNTLATIALMLAIIGVVLSFFLIGIPLLVLSLLLGIIALFKAPRGKAWASIIISAIPLGFLGWFIWMFGGIVIGPTIAFYHRVQEEIRINPTMAAVFKQPGFDKFMQQKLQETFTATDRQKMLVEDSIPWEEITAVDSLKKEVSKAIDFTFERLKGEIPTIVDAWIAQYGLPEGIQESEWLIPWPLSATSWTLKEFDGQPVSGTYVLSFGLNELSTKFCNTLNGTLSITDTTFTVPALMSTKMFCTDEEANRLETAFTPDGAQFSIASTRMASDNLASLAITTTSGHLFLYTTPSLWDIASITDEATREDEVIQDVAEILNDLHQDTL